VYSDSAVLHSVDKGVPREGMLAAHNRSDRGKEGDGSTERRRQAQGNMFLKDRCDYWVYDQAGSAFLPYLAIRRSFGI